MNISLNDNRTVTYGQTIENKPATGADEVKSAANTETTEGSVRGSDIKENPQRASLVENVLIAAGLVSNEASERIVEFLIGRQMPVDRDSVRKLVSENKAYPKTDLDMLSLMNRNHIPVNEASIKGMEHFLNSETMLAEALDKVFEDIEHMLEAEGAADESAAYDEAGSGTANISGELYSEVVSEYVEAGTGVAEASETTYANVVAEAAETAYANVDAEAAEAAYVNVDAEAAEAAEAANILTGTETAEMIDTAGSEAADDNPDGAFQAGSADSEEGLEEGAVRSSARGTDTEDGITLTRSEIRAGINAYKMTEGRNASYNWEPVYSGDRAIKTLRPGAVTVVKAETAQIMDDGPKESLREAVAKLASEDGFICDENASGRELVARLREKLSMKPDEINRESIKKLYESVSELLSKSSDASDVGGHSQLKAHAAEAQKLLEFMRDASDIYPYVEIPVRLNDSRTEAGLYVYSKDKGRRIDPENCTALLHIDMPHLGLIDIRLKLSGRALGMMFSSDEEPMRLLESEIGELVSSLEEKDYTVTPRFEVRGTDDSGVIKESNASKEDVSEEQGYDPGNKSFDVRA